MKFTNRLKIGTTDPTEALDVTGNIKASGNINAVTALQLNGTSINTTGTLTNVAYKGQNNLFTVNQTISNPTGTATKIDLVNGAFSAGSTGLYFHNISSATITPTITGYGSGHGLYLIGYANSTNSTDRNFYMSARKVGGTTIDKGRAFTLSNYTTELFSVLYDGKTKIGSGDASEALDVAGNIKASGTGNFGNTITQNLLGTVGYGLVTSFSGTYQNAYLSHIAKNASNVQQWRANWNRSSDNTKYFLQFLNGSDAFYWNALGFDYTNKRVGINNVSPTEVLDVTGNIKASGAVSSVGASSSVDLVSTAFAPQVSISDINTGYNWYLQHRLDLRNHFRIQYYNGVTYYAPFSIELDAPSNSITASSAGVGIRTPYSGITDALTVNGNIKASGTVTAVGINVNGSVQATYFIGSGSSLSSVSKLLNKTNATAEADINSTGTQLYSYSIGAGVIGTSGVLKIQIIGYIKAVSSGGTVGIEVLLGGTRVGYSTYSMPATTTVNFEQNTTISNNNSASAQISSNILSMVTTMKHSVLTTSVNTANAQSLTIKLYGINGYQTRASLSYVLVELVN